MVESLPDSARPANGPLSGSLAIDETLIAYLLGQERLHPRLEGRAALEHPAENARDRLLATRFWDELPDPQPESPALALWGPDQASQAAAARRLAAALGLPLLRLDLEPLPDDPQEAFELLELAIRDARLYGAALQVQNWQACLSDSHPPAAWLLALDRQPLPVILSGTEPWLPDGARRGRLLWFEFPIPGYAQRMAIWQFALEEVASIPPGELEQLAGQFLLTSGQIFNAAASARDQAHQAGRDLQARDLFAAARDHSNPRLSSLARKIRAALRLG